MEYHSDRRDFLMNQINYVNLACYMHAVVVYLSRCLSHAGTVSEWLNIGSRNNATRTRFLMANNISAKFEWDHPLTRTRNAGEVV